MNKTDAIDKLTTKYSISIKPAEVYYWSPDDQTVYHAVADTSEQGIWTLLHESGHALLNHERYYSDFELVHMEAAAWEKAKELAAEFGVEIDENHLQDCLDSYRNWLHKRSLCPDCSLSSIQVNEKTYTCIFCHKRWQVTKERFCRPYRKLIQP